MKKLFTDGIILATGMAFGRIMQVVGGVFLARYLGAEGFGIYSLALATAGVVAQAAAGGLGGVMAVECAKIHATSAETHKRKLYALLVITMAMSALVSVATLAFAFGVAPYLFKGGGAWDVFLCAGIVISIGVIELSLQGVVSGFGRDRVIIGSSVINGLLSLILVPMMGLAWGVSAALIGMIVASVFGLMPLVRSSLKIASDIKLASFPAQRGDYSRAYWSDVFPVAAGTAILAPMRWISLVMVERMDGGLVQLAYFSVANQVHGAINFFTQSVRFGIRKMYAKNELTDQRKESNLIAIMAVILTVLSLFVWLFRDQIAMIYGPDYLGASESIVISSVACMSFMLFSFLVDKITARSPSKSPIVFGHLACGCVWIASTYMIPGSMGLAWGLLLGFLSGFFVMKYCKSRIP